MDDQTARVLLRAMSALLVDRIRDTHESDRDHRQLLCLSRSAVQDELARLKAEARSRRQAERVSDGGGGDRPAGGLAPWQEDPSHGVGGPRADDPASRDQSLGAGRPGLQSQPPRREEPARR